MAIPTGANPSLARACTQNPNAEWSRCRCGRGEPSLGADVGGVSPGLLLGHGVDGRLGNIREQADDVAEIAPLLELDGCIRQL